MGEPAGTVNSYIFVGPLVHSTNLNQIKCVPRGALVVKNGKIAALLDDAQNLKNVQEKLGLAEIEVHHIKSGGFLMPGLVDCHIHAPQFPNAGLGYNTELLGWLKATTFPTEAKYSDVKFAKKVYQAIVRTTLLNGTTTACYFATIHKEAALLLADTTIKMGQRAFIGKVNMNINSPPELTESTKESLQKTEEFIVQVQQKNSPLVKPILTPRFALSCDMELMKGLGDLATKYNVHVQTHLAENKGEVKEVAKTYPEYENYTAVYDAAGLLTSKTVMAHSIYLSEAEVEMLHNRGTSIAHCPNSNTTLKSGIMDVRNHLNHNVKVGLGTDVSGGYSPSILDAMRHALGSSLNLSFTKGDSYVPLDYHEAFYLATLGGAKALALEDTVGNFEVGKDFDALLINLKGDDSSVDLVQDYKIEDLVQKFIYLGDDRNISSVFVAGREVKGQLVANKGDR